MTELENKTKLKIAECLAKNYDKLKNSFIDKIHEDINLYYSSVNLFIGKQGKGKSLTVLSEIVKLSNIKSNVHMFIYITKNGRVDDTCEAIKELITIPIVYVSVDDIEEFLSDLYLYKQVYDKIKCNYWGKPLEEEQQKEVLDKLHLDDFSLPTLQEVILFDDAAFSKLLSKRDSLIVSMAHEARHYKFIFCFCVQGIKDIPLPIKEQTTTNFIYSGFLNQKLPIIYQQSGIKSVDYQEFKRIYNELGEKDYIIVNCKDGTFRISENADLTDLIEYFRNNLP